MKKYKKTFKSEPLDDNDDFYVFKEMGLKHEYLLYQLYVSPTKAGNEENLNGRMIMSIGFCH